MKRVVLFLGFCIAVDWAVWSLLTKGLEHYFGLDIGADILFVGHSHTVLAVDKVELEELTGLSIAKYARRGANLADRIAMTRQYIDRHPDRVRLVVFGVESHIFTKAGLSRNSHKLFLPFLDEPVVRQHLTAHGVGFDELLVRQILRSSRFDETTLALSLRGLTSNWRSYKRGRVHIDRLKAVISKGDFRRIAFDEAELERFSQFLLFLKDREIRVALALYPTIDTLNDAEPRKFSRAVQLFKGLAEPRAGVWLLDYNSDLTSRHELFFDPVHVNREGQVEVTKRLAQDLVKLMK